MKSRPILFSGPMVRAILNGTKTQTRRIVTDESLITLHADGTPAKAQPRCKYGQPGDQLWVRENCRLSLEGLDGPEIQYQADMNFADIPVDSNNALLYNWITSQGNNPKAWRPSILMPRFASRITLEITRVRVERLQDISERDAMAEGIFLNSNDWWDCGNGLRGEETPVAAYRALWETINGQGSWALNPWVWVVEFRKVDQ